MAEIQNGVLLMTVLFQNAYVLCMRSERRPLHREPILSNPWLLLGIGVALSFQLIGMFWSPLGRVLGTMPVSGETLLFCAGGTGVTVIVTELTKRGVVLWQRSATASASD